MPDVFESQLRQMVDQAERRSRRDFRLLVEDLGEEAYLIVAGGGESMEADRSRRTLCQKLQRVVSVLNACALVRRTVLASHNGFAKTIPIKPIVPRTGLRPAQAAIDDAFASGEVPNRGLCYVAWAGSPRAFLYVGQGESKKRLDLDRHALLATSLGWARRISLVFPGVKSQVSGLEASLIAIIEAAWGQKPRFNRRTEKVPKGPATRVVEDITNNLWCLADDLSPRQAPRKVRPVGDSPAQPPDVAPTAP